MTVKSFFLTMGAGVAVGALGAMMLPKNSDAYRMTKQAAKAIQSEAEKAVDAISSAMYRHLPPGLPLTGEAMRMPKSKASPSRGGGSAKPGRRGYLPHASSTDTRYCHVSVFRRKSFKSSFWFSSECSTSLL